MKLEQLSVISSSVPINELSKDQICELQTGLSLLGYPIGDVDGLIGPKTRNAWAEFKIDVLIDKPELIEKRHIDALNSKLELATKEAAYDFSSKTGTIEAIKHECRKQGIGLSTQIAYVLATTQWETNETFEPVREAYWLSENWRKSNLRYYPFYGRGFVQLTWENNYRKYSELLGIDMVTKPDDAMAPNVALFILVHGFKTGAFTGRKITDYINDTTTDFISARRCINGTDKAHQIADIAKKYLADL